MEFHIVVLSDCIGSYESIDWTDWKDHLSDKMLSQGDHWSMTTLSGTDIWNCLEHYSINSHHLVAWKPVADTLYQVSLPDHPHPFDKSV